MRPVVYILIALLCSCNGSQKAAAERAEELKQAKTKVWITTHRELLAQIESVYRDYLRLTEPRLPKTIERGSELEQDLVATCEEFLLRLRPLSAKLGETSLTGDWQLITDVLRIVDGLGFVYSNLRTGIKTGRFDREINTRRQELIERGPVFEQIAKILSK